MSFLPLNKYNLRHYQGDQEYDNHLRMHVAMSLMALV